MKGSISFSLVYNHLELGIVLYYLRINFLYLRGEWVAFRRVRHVVPACFYRSPEWIQTK